MKAVVFDMDGILFDTESLGIKCWDWAGEQIGIGKAGFMVFETMGRTTPESVKIFKNRYGDKFNNDKFQEKIKEFCDDYFGKYGVPQKDGLYDILAYLKQTGYRIAVASSSSQKSVLHHLNDAKITECFDEIICGDMITKSKPEPDIYLTAAKKLGLNPNECYAVEDSKAGLLSAKASGCKVVFIKDLYEPDEEINSIIDLSFNNLTEFMQYLKGLD